MSSEDENDTEEHGENDTVKDVDRPRRQSLPRRSSSGDEFAIVVVSPTFTPHLPLFFYASLPLKSLRPQYTILIDTRFAYSRRLTAKQAEQIVDYVEDYVKKVDEQQNEIQHLRKRLNFTVKALKRERDLREKMQQRWQSFLGCCFCACDVSAEPERIATGVQQEMRANRKFFSFAYFHIFATGGTFVR